MAGIYKKYEDYESAIQIYNNNLLKQGNLDDYAKADILYRRGGSYERLKMYLKADNDLLLSIEKSDEPYVLNYLAYSWLERSQNIDKVINMLNQAYDLKTDDPYITDHLMGLLSFRRLLERRKIFEKSSELMPNDPIVNDHYGDILWKLDRKSKRGIFGNLYYRWKIQIKT